MKSWGVFFIILLMAAVGYFMYRLGLWDNRVKPRLYRWLELEQTDVMTLNDSIRNARQQQPLMSGLSGTGDSLKTEQEMQKNMIDDDLKNLNRLKSEIDSLLTIDNADQKANLQKLAKIYEAMRPNEVAQLSANMDDKTLARILAVMKPRNAARVLGEITRLDPVKSAELSKLILKLRTG